MGRKKRSTDTVNENGNANGQTEEKKYLDISDQSSVVDPVSNELDKPVELSNKEKLFYFLENFGNMVFLNVVFFITCIPVITIGVSFTALYSMTLKMVRKEEGNVVGGYFEAFKKNFIPATKAWCLVLVYLWVIYIEYQYMLRAQEQLSNILMMVIGLELVLLSFVLPLLFPLIARYENTTFRYFKNSLILSVSRFPVWIRVFISWTGPALLTLAKPVILYYAWYVWAFILSSLLAYSCSLVIRRLFDELEDGGDAAKSDPGTSGK